MRWIYFGLIVVHALIHFMGVAKAFGLAELAQLAQPIGRGMGGLWLAAGLALLAAAGLFLAASSFWWLAAFGAGLLSQGVIFTSWGDARFGSIANLVILAGAVYGFAAEGPPSFRREYRREVDVRLAAPVTARLVTEADLAPLPEPVQRYLRLNGAVGRPRVDRFKAVWRGRIRATAEEPWMELTAEQYSFTGSPARFFLIDATRSGLPVKVFHAFQADAATMRVRLLALVPLVNARGPELDRAETVTFFNELCLLAPAALVDAPVRWESIDARSVRAHYTLGAHTISAVLHFNEADELVDFVSDDRVMASPDGARLIPQRWSTPVDGYRNYGPHRVMTRGEGRWHPPEGAFTYLELELLDLEINGRL